jgi:hypothetical protein
VKMNVWSLHCDIYSIIGHITNHHRSEGGPFHQGIVVGPGGGLVVAAAPLRNSELSVAQGRRGGIFWLRFCRLRCCVCIMCVCVCVGCVCVCVCVCV